MHLLINYCLGGSCIKTLSGHTSLIFCLLYLPEENSIASGSSDNTIRIWDQKSKLSI